MTVLIATCQPLPEPDPDEPLLLDALRRAGVRPQMAVWDDPRVNWGASDLVVIRSTWDYHVERPRFLAWAERVAAATRLWNPVDVVRWSTHKAYLLDLASAGVPIAPTRLLRRGEREPLASVVASMGWDDVVVKPAVSAGSFQTLRVRAGELAVGEAHLASLLASRDALVQRYLPSVEGYGERALVFVDGELTHSVRKSPRFAGDDERVSEALPIAPAEAALARAALAAAPGPLLYGRVDVAPGPDGAPCVMELELVEPSLFLAQHPRALDRLVAGILARV